MFIGNYIHLWNGFIQIIIFYMIFLSFNYVLYNSGSAWVKIPASFIALLGASKDTRPHIISKVLKVPPNGLFYPKRVVPIAEILNVI